MDTEVINKTVNVVVENTPLVQELIDTTLTVMGIMVILMAFIFFTKIIIEHFKNRKRKCTICNHSRRIIDLKKHDKKYYCMSCYKKNFNVCDVCEKVVSEKLMKFHKKKLCNYCYSTKIIKCKKCNKKYGKWEMYNVNGFNNYCEKCYNKDYREFKTIRFRPTKINPTTFNKNPFARYCGVEIECRNRNRNRNCFVKRELKELKYSQCRDGSINPGGVEFVSRPMNGDNLFNSITSFCNILNKKRYFVDKSCGLHIHLEVPKKVDYLKNIYLFYEKFEPLLFNMVPRSRQRTDYCKKYKTYYDNSIQTLFKTETLDEFKSMVYETKSKLKIKNISSKHNYNKRYCWINFHSIFYRGTLEIRNHSGTISSTKINNWLLLHLTILNYLNKINLDTINELEVNKKTFLSIFDKRLQNYIKQRWGKFEKGNMEEKD